VLVLFGLLGNWLSFFVLILNRSVVYHLISDRVEELAVHIPDSHIEILVIRGDIVVDIGSLQQSSEA
jgi:hypothetical protein